MKIAIISGSHRVNSQSEKVSRYIEKTLLDNEECDDTWLFSLADNPLPLWEEGIWDKDPAWEERLNPIREELQSSDGLVIIAPEWHGQVPAGLKNFFLMVSRFDVGHKPAMIVTVSSADGGSYPVAELRMSSYKNNRILYIPEHVIVRNVESVLNENPADNNEGADSYFRERISWSLGVLLAYAGALKPVRESGITLNAKFGNGM
ncbi:MAG: NAD(P)H-dependent oxidoreductase [Gammaproteobacteria bacterium]|nr:NAD(P)H-dependent oxidoreductase [Gammaproteobacteria bacterium]MDX2486007.1 NAD(P)H-dependent oxidoreductase [Gammaproteobacteria bacterium]